MTVWIEYANGGRRNIFSTKQNVLDYWNYLDSTALEDKGTSMSRTIPGSIVNEVHYNEVHYAEEVLVDEEIAKGTGLQSEKEARRAHKTYTHTRRKNRTVWIEYANGGRRNIFSTKQNVLDYWNYLDRAALEDKGTSMSHTIPGDIVNEVHYAEEVLVDEEIAKAIGNNNPRGKQ